MNNDSGLIPTEFCVIVEMDAPKEKVGSLFLPSDIQEKDKLSADEGTLLAVSPAAFSYADWPEGARKPTPGDRVIFRRYSGLLREDKARGRTFRLLNDKDIVAIVDNAEMVGVRGEVRPLADFAGSRLGGGLINVSS